MNPNLPNSFRSGPDETGHFGSFGGRFVAETLMPLILDLEQAYAEAKADPAFHAEMSGYLKDYVGRPSPLYYSERLSQHLGDGRTGQRLRGCVQRCRHQLPGIRCSVSDRLHGFDER